MHRRCKKKTEEPPPPIPKVPGERKVRFPKIKQLPPDDQLAVTINPLRDEMDMPPCYLPQREVNLDINYKKEDEEEKAKIIGYEFKEKILEDEVKCPICPADKAKKAQKLAERLKEEDEEEVEKIVASPEDEAYARAAIGLPPHTGTDKQGQQDADMSLKERKRQERAAKAIKVDWSPMAPLTGTRPLVDRYSIARYSTNEWREKNFETLKMAHDAFENVQRNEFNARTAKMRVNTLIEKHTNKAEEDLRTRVKIIEKWKINLERCIKAMANEISLMEEERNRLKKSLVILGIPESIVRECIEKRSGRLETEIVRDSAEEALHKELELIAEIRLLMNKTLADFEQQQAENRTARQRMEFDWSDKREAFEIDLLNFSLTPQNPTILFRPGAIKQQVEQSSAANWAHFSHETMDDCETCRQKSMRLRQTLNSIMLNSARDLRTQADAVERALGIRIRCTQESLQRFQNELDLCLRKLADTENRIEALHAGIRGYDATMKVTQTRLYNRNSRPNNENCRDKPQESLITQAHVLQSGVSGMLAHLDAAQESKKELITLRNRLEHEILLKRRTLSIDQERCMLLRAHYPSANALSGFAQF